MYIYIYIYIYIFEIFKGKHLCWSLFLIFSKAASLKACNFIKKRWCFPGNIAKFLRRAFLKNTTGDFYKSW